MTSQKKCGLAILILLLVGMATALYLTSLHYRLMIPGKSPGKSIDSICDVNATVNCAAVNASKYAAIGPVPVAGLGFLFYGICLALTLVAFKRPRVWIFLFLLSVPTLLITGYMLYASSQLGLVCLFCIVMAIINLLLFGSFAQAAGITPQNIGHSIRSYLRSPADLLRWGLVTVLALGIGSLVLAKLTKAYERKRAEQIEWQRRRQGEPLALSTEQMDEVLATFYAAPVRSLTIPANRPRIGDANAPLQVIEFVDFQCPACKQAAETLPAFLNAHYPDRYSIVQLHYPLDQGCNPKIKRRMHPFACEAAKLGACVREAGKDYWDFEELAFANQGEMRSETLKDWAVSVGLTRAEIDGCLLSPEIATQVAEDVRLGEAAPVHGTPTIFLNGRDLQSLWRDPVLFKRLIERELKSVE